MNKKQLITISVVLFNFLLGGTAIFIAWRTRYAKPPTPSKADIGGGDACVLDFDIGEVPTPTPTPPPECDFWCVELTAYDSSWEELTNPENLDLQTIYFVVKGATNGYCPDLDRGQFGFAKEGEAIDNWSYSSDPPPSGVDPECDSDEYYCFYWEIPGTGFAEGECYDAEAEVCIGDDCR